MKENRDARPCDNRDELVSFLYGEADELEAKEFERHMERCVACKDDFLAFSRVREEVIEWRNQSLPSFNASQGAAQAAIATTRQPARSALAALREFFTLSPAWMRAATIAAALAVCALIALTIVHFSEQPKVVVVEKAVPAMPSQQEIEALAQRRAEELRQREKEEAASGAVKPAVETATAGAPAKNAKAGRASKSSSTVAGRQNREMPNRINATQEVRQQLAELVQSSREEDSSPRLSDLLDDSSESN